MIDITEYNTRNFSVEAKERNGTRWLEFSFSGQSLYLFFDSKETFDAALRKLQSCSAPEPEARKESGYTPPDEDEEVPF